MTNFPIALGVALIPSAKWCRLFENWNRLLIAGSTAASNSTAGALLFDESHLPHLTLYQCFIDYEACLSGIERFKAMIPEMLLPFEIPVLGISEGNSVSNGETTPWLDLAPKNSKLAHLHSAARQTFEQFASYELTKNEALNAFSEYPVTEDCIRFIQEYPSRSRSGIYSPHVTIGFGRFECLADVKIGVNENLEVDRIVVGRIGNYCSMGKENFCELVSRSPQ